MIDKFHQYCVRSHFQITKKCSFRVGSLHVTCYKLPGKKNGTEKFFI